MLDLQQLVTQFSSKTIRSRSIIAAFAPVAYRSKTLSPTQLEMTFYAKQFLTIYFAFKEFGHIDWGNPRSATTLTDNNLVT